MPRAIATGQIISSRVKKMDNEREKWSCTDGGEGIRRHQMLV